MGCRSSSAFEDRGDFFRSFCGILETYLVISQNPVPRTSHHALVHVAGRASMPLAEQEAHSTHLSDAGWLVGGLVGWLVGRSVGRWVCLC